jgi:hypothetical protein
MRESSKGQSARCRVEQMFLRGIYPFDIVTFEVTMSKGLTSETPMNKGFQRSFLDLPAFVGT